MYYTNKINAKIINMDHKRIKRDKYLIIGYRNTIIGSYNIIIGNKHIIEGNENTIVGNNTKFNGNFNQIFGDNTKFWGDHNTGFCNNCEFVGDHNKIEGDNITIDGNGNEIWGENIKVEGNWNKVNGNYVNKHERKEPPNVKHRKETEEKHFKETKEPKSLPHESYTCNRYVRPYTSISGADYSILDDRLNPKNKNLEIRNVGIYENILNYCKGMGIGKMVINDVQWKFKIANRGEYLSPHGHLKNETFIIFKSIYFLHHKKEKVMIYSDGRKMNNHIYNLDKSEKNKTILTSKLLRCEDFKIIFNIEKKMIRVYNYALLNFCIR
jgi:hypothetical protein